MKLKYILIAAVVLFATSCKTFEGKEFELQNYVTLSTHKLDIAESFYDEGKSSRVDVVDSVFFRRSTRDMSQPLEVNFSVQYEGVGAQASTKLSATETIVIPAGQALVGLAVTSLNDDDDNGDRHLNIEITGTNDPSYNLGYPGWENPIEERANMVKEKSGKYVTINILEDDCPFDMTKLAGDLSYKQTGVLKRKGVVTVARDADDNLVVQGYIVGGITVKVILDKVNKTAKMETTTIGGQYRIDPNGTGDINSCNGTISVPMTFTEIKSDGTEDVWGDGVLNIYFKD